MILALCTTRHAEVCASDCHRDVRRYSGHTGPLPCPLPARASNGLPVAFPVLTRSSRRVVDDRLDLVELLSDLTPGDFHIVAVL